MKGLLVDIRALRESRPFAALWVGTSLAGLGSQIATLAVLAQMWAITENVVWTGAIGLATAVPILLLGPVGGSLADRHDRRTLVRAATLAQVGTAGGLAAQALMGNSSPLLLLLLVATNAGVGALGAPARRALPPRLLPPDKLGGAYSLLNLSFQFSMLVGPALGGLLVAWATPAAYAAQLIAALASLLLLAFIPPVPPSSTSTKNVSGQGWSLVFRKRTLRGAFATDIAATAFAMPIAVFPLLNDLYFESDPRTLGLFLSAIAAGGVVAGLLSGSIARTRHLGRMMIAAALAWTIAIGLVGIANVIWIALLLLAVAGAADTVAVISRGVLVQLETPDHARGRISAAEQVVGVASPEIGNFRGGLLASAIGGPASVVIGGAGAFVMIALIAATNRDLRSHSIADQEATSTDAHAA